MSNLIEYKMRVRGKKESCQKFYEDLVYSVSDNIVSESGSEDDYVIQIEGETKNSVKSSMLNMSYDRAAFSGKKEDFLNKEIYIPELPLDVKSKILDLEIEVYGGGDEDSERYKEYIYLKHGERVKEKYGRDIYGLWKVKMKTEISEDKNSEKSENSLETELSPRIEYIVNQLKKLYPDGVITESILKKEKLLDEMRECRTALGYQTMEMFIQAQGYTYSTHKNFIINKNGTIKKYLGMGGDVIIPEGVKSISCFDFIPERGIINLYIPKTVSKVNREGYYFEYLRPLNEYVVDPENQHYKSVDGVLYSKNGKRLIDCPVKMESITVPEGVEIIENIHHCECEEVIIPASVKVFQWFYAGGNYVVDEANEAFRSVEGALYSKDMSVLYRCPTDKRGKFVVPSETKKIAHYAFENCDKINLIEVPKSVKELERYAFNGYNSVVEFKGSDTKWEEWVTGCIAERYAANTRKYKGSFLRTQKRLTDPWRDAFETGETEVLDYAYVALYQSGWIDVIDKKMRMQGMHVKDVFTEMIKLLELQKKFSKSHIKNLAVFIKEYEEFLEKEQIEKAVEILNSKDGVLINIQELLEGMT